MKHGAALISPGHIVFFPLRLLFRADFIALERKCETFFPPRASLGRPNKYFRRWEVAPARGRVGILILTEKQSYKEDLFGNHQYCEITTNPPTEQQQKNIKGRNRPEKVEYTWGHGSLLGCGARA